MDRNDHRQQESQESGGGWQDRRTQQGETGGSRYGGQASQYADETRQTGGGGEHRRGQEHQRSGQGPASYGHEGRQHERFGPGSGFAPSSHGQASQGTWQDSAGREHGAQGSQDHWQRGQQGFGQAEQHGQSGTWHGDDLSRRGRSSDPNYRAWRQNQLEQFDREYEEYCRERQDEFDRGFDEWRSKRRQGQGSGDDHPQTTAAEPTGSSGAAGSEAKK